MSVIDDRAAQLYRGLDALELGDLEEFMAMVEASSHPDCEFHSAVGSELGGTVFRGFDGLRAWFGDVLETVDEPRWKNRRYEPVGDSAFLVFCTFEMTGHASQAVVAGDIGILYELEDGLMKRGRSYTSQAEARAAAEALLA